MAVGDISLISQRSSANIYAAGCYVARISDTLFASLYRPLNFAQPLTLETRGMSAAGVIDAAATDSINIAEGDTFDFTVFYIRDNIIGVGLQNYVGRFGTIKTYDVTGGVISALDSATFSTLPDLVGPKKIQIWHRLTDDIFIYTYNVSGGAGEPKDVYVATVEIDSAGNITFLTRLKLNTVDADIVAFVSLVQVHEDVFAVAYGEEPVGAATRFVHTFRVSSDGLIITSIERRANLYPAGGYPVLTKCANGVFAASANETPGTISTFNIDNNGVIGATLDSQQFTTAFEPGTGVRMSSCGTGPDLAYRVIVCEQGTNDAWANTVKIDGSGNITPLKHRESYAGTVSTTFITRMTENIHIYYYRDIGLDDLYWESLLIPNYKALPEGTTDPATEIGENSAVLNGTLTEDGTEGLVACTVYFEYRRGTGAVSTTAAQSFIAVNSFSENITGLDPGTLYNFRAIFTNDVGTTYGSWRSFLTGGSPPSVLPIAIMTLPATNITGKSAILNGSIINDDSRNLLVRFEWGIDGRLGNRTPWMPGYVAGDTFSDELTPLKPGTMYLYRAMAIYNGVVYYGGIVSFVTLGGWQIPNQVIIEMLEA
ncbi:MAG: hypothetical protein PHW65_01625 [Dehalococcoidales bacterium]|nr:hypothetical protein [Dehalococcoidales bacterium]